MEISLPTKGKKKPTKLEDMTKEQIRQAILKKRECNTKAQHIVESLLEKGITEKYFLKCLSDINQSHFEDVIEERSITHLCGYPLCSKSLSASEIPKQKYRISTKTNKVYDITGRKSFCSNSCYKSAMHVKVQMLTSPLWFRDYEDIPQFNLLPLDSVGSLGQEVDLAIVQKVKVKTVINAITPVDFASASINNMTPHDQLDEDVEDSKTNACPTEPIKDECTDKTEKTIENVPVEVTTPQNTTTTKTIEHKKPAIENKVKSKPQSNPLNIIGEVIEKPERKVDPILSYKPETKQNETKKPDIRSKTPKKTKEPPSVTVITIEDEKCLAQWFTLDTMLFLFGEEKVREMVTDKGECIQEYLNNYAKSIFYNSNTYDQYQALCRKLNMLELEDKRYDSQTLQRETKPLPDYSIIKEESKKMQLKVRAYFAGETDISETPATNEDNTTEETEGKSLTQLPLVDKNAQNALRRRIVCQHLNKVLPDLLKSLGLLTLSISSDVRLLVNTFKLKANNIMFKPLQWTLIAIVVIKLLSLRDRRLSFLLQQSMAYEHMQLLLLSYQQDGGYLERLVAWLTDIDRLLDTSDTQLTIE